MIDDSCALGGGDADVELEEERLDGGRGGLLAGEGDEDVSILLDELEEVVGGQGWAEALGLCGEQEDVIVGALIMLKESDLVSLGRIDGGVEAASCRHMLALRR